MIADASLYSGLKISYESVFQHLKPSFVQRNTLPSLLSDLGYKTVVVEPKDRARPGVELENEFGFDQTVFYADLDWQGPEWGWGIIPDQHTLGWLREKVIEPAEQPLFISFHMVASHAPWRSPPPLLENWRELAKQPLGEDHLESAEKKLLDLFSKRAIAVATVEQKKGQASQKARDKEALGTAEKRVRGFDAAILAAEENVKQMKAAAAAVAQSKAAKAAAALAKEEATKSLSEAGTIVLCQLRGKYANQGTPPKKEIFIFFVHRLKI